MVGAGGSTVDDCVAVADTITAELLPESAVPRSDCSMYLNIPGSSKNKKNTANNTAACHYMTS